MAIGKAIDYSQARPPLTQVKAAGFSAVYRYVCSNNSEAGLPGKRLTATERDQILGAGLDIGLHGEDNATAAQGGYSQGKTQGAQWADYAHNVLGAPAGMTIVAAIDYDTAGVYPTVVRDYLRGVKDGLAGQYVTGVYGSFWVVRGALEAGDAVHGVQALAWSSGYGPTQGCRICDIPNWDAEVHTHIYRGAHLYQHGGTQFSNTDYNDIYIIPHGTWEQTLMSVNGPEKWDAADWAAMKNGLAALQDYDPTHPNAPSVATVAKVLIDVRDGAAGQKSLPWVVDQLKAAVTAAQNAIISNDNSDAATASAKLDALAGQVTDLETLVKQSPTLSGTLDVSGQLTITEQAPPAP